MSDAAAAAAPAAASGDAASATFVAGEKPGVTGSAPSNDSEVKVAIKKQVEYYFSDANFPKDKFLVAETAKDKEQWVNISVLATFNRMKVRLALCCARPAPLCRARPAPLAFVLDAARTRPSAGAGALARHPAHR